MGRLLLAEGREAEVFVGEDPRTVLKLMRDPAQGDRVAREATALRTLEADGYPAPRVVETVVVDGRPGLVMERSEGLDHLAVIGRRPLAVFRAGRCLGRAHAAMHDVAAPAELPDLEGHLRTQIEEAVPLPDDLRRRALASLDRLPGGDRLTHGDLHPGNVLGAWRSPVIIDWGDASRGNPVADVARTALLLRVGEPPPGASWVLRTLTSVGRRILRDGYLAGYRALRPIDHDQLARWEVVRAAARLHEPVPDEHPALLRFLETEPS